jgi:hypothetical protein
MANGPSLNQAEMQPIIWNDNQCNYWWQNILNTQHIKMSINGVSTLIRLLCTAIYKRFGCCCV